MTWIRRASLDLDFVVAGPGWQAGEWVRHVLDRTEGVQPGSVQVISKGKLQTELEYTSSETGKAQNLKVDKLDAGQREVDLRTETIEHDGVKTLAPERLAELKLQTLVGPEPRLKARDIYDATHVMRRYHCALTRKQCTTLSLISDNLFERERQWVELFDRDEVLSADLFETIREAFTKTTSWRREGMDSGDTFEPVEGGETRSTAVVGRYTVDLVDNRPTHEGERIGTARGAQQAAEMLIEGGLAASSQKEPLIAEIQQEMEQVRAQTIE